MPGQVYYDATRKLVLQGADGVVFVADSQRAQRDDNIESFRNLHVNLVEQGVDPRTIPVVLQYNKRDLPDVMTLDEMDDLLNYRDLPRYQAEALSGGGVFDTLRGISEAVLRRLAQRWHRCPRR